MIRKIAIIFCLSFITCNSIFAQKLAYGPELGLGIIPISKNQVDGITTKLGFNGGLFCAYPINDFISVKLSAKAVTSSKSYVKTDTSSISNTVIQMFSAVDTNIAYLVGDYLNTSITSTIKGNINFTSLRIPLSIDFQINKNFIFSLGGYASFLLQANTNEEMTQDIPLIRAVDPLIAEVPFAKQLIKGFYPAAFEPEFKETSNTNNLNTTDFGLDLALLYKLENNLFFSFRYNYGFVDYYKTRPDMYEVNSAKHSSMTVSIGYTFGNIYTSKQKKRYYLDVE